jgi:hypothetical protein
MKKNTNGKRKKHESERENGEWERGTKEEIYKTREVGGR